MSDIQIRTNTIGQALKGLIGGIESIGSDLDRGATKVTLGAQKSIFSSVDVNGVAFAPLKSGEKRRPLLLSGRLVTSFGHAINNSSVTIFNSAPYADKHNNGFGVTMRRFLDEQQALQTLTAELGGNLPVTR